MQNRIRLKSNFIFCCIAALGLGAVSANAQHGGGGHAVGGHFGGGGGGHVFVGHGHGYGGYGRGGYGGYGYRGGYGYYRGGYYGGWGWGGLGLGLYFASLPLVYSTYWWDGIPYYYANNTYYRYDGSARQYLTVAPPEGLAERESAQVTAPSELIAYPKNGQTTDQQATDKYECHHWATTQSGFDPTAGASAAGSAGKRNDYLRAQEACLDGRGYSVK